MSNIDWNFTFLVAVLAPFLVEGDFFNGELDFLDLLGDVYSSSFVIVASFCLGCNKKI